VVRYEPPIETVSWTAGPLLAADPEGAAFDVASAMQQGNVNNGSLLRGCGARQSHPEAPGIAEAVAAAPGSTFIIVGRVIADADVIVELHCSIPNTSRKNCKSRLRRRMTAGG